LSKLVALTSVLSLAGVVCAVLGCSMLVIGLWLTR
jgi:hypothetical protein